MKMTVGNEDKRKKWLLNFPSFFFSYPLYAEIITVVALFNLRCDFRATHLLRCLKTSLFFEWCFLYKAVYSKTGEESKQRMSRNLPKFPLVPSIFLLNIRVKKRQHLHGRSMKTKQNKASNHQILICHLMEQKHIFFIDKWGNFDSVILKSYAVTLVFAHRDTRIPTQLFILAR